MNTLWKIFAAWLVRDIKRVAWVIDHAQVTPYFHLPGYMHRWWLVKRHPWLPFSIRVHHILRRDLERTPHNHPCNFRSIVLMGWYMEEVLMPDGGTRTQFLNKGDTYKRTTKDYHRISDVSPGGVFTLFICGRKQQSWGFLVDDKHIPWREYLNDPEDGE